MVTSKFCVSSPVQRIGDLSSYSLIVACVGVGNISQLVCDLLVYNLECELVADVDFNYTKAVVGGDPYGNSKHGSSCQLMSCSQLYACQKLRLAILQIRAPHFSGCKQKHTDELEQFLLSANFRKVILLSSSFASARKDEDLRRSPLRYAVSSSFDSNDRNYLEELNITPLILADPGDQVLHSKRQADLFRLPGCGIANRLYGQLLKSTTNSTIPSVCLLNYFTSEGDNSTDSLFVVRHLDLWLKLTSTNLQEISGYAWSAPVSWMMLFGNDGLPSLY